MSLREINRRRRETRETRELAERISIGIEDWQAPLPCEHCARDLEAGDAAIEIGDLIVCSEECAEAEERAS